MKSIVKGIIKTVLWIVAIIVNLILALISCIILIQDPFAWRAPKDKTIIALFQEHREAFEKIQQMAMEDMQQDHYLNMYNLDFQKGNEFRKENLIPESRQQEYKKLLSGIPLPCRTSIYADVYGQTLRITLAGGGFLLAIGSGWGKGIEFYSNKPKDLGVIVSSLDKIPSNAEPRIYLRPIGTSTNWFLYYQVDD